MKERGNVFGLSAGLWLAVAIFAAGIGFGEDKAVDKLEGLAMETQIPSPT